jgi:hypothetical protein
MTDELFTRDPALGDALAKAAADPMHDRVDWTALQRTINARASSELTRRRARRRGMRIAIPAGIAAGIALAVLVTRAPERTGIGNLTNGPAEAETSIDELLDANVSDGQFRALLSGAGEANDLLSIAAGEGQP